MRTNILVSRICRLLETAGESGDGASLSEEYASAVSKVNERLESVVAAADANSIGDAIRLLSEDPPLLEEVSTLDFFQLQDWECLCDMNGWQIPPKIDKQMMERAVEIGETKDAIAPFLAMYKKAIRINNVRLAVKSLRRLVDLDTTQDWTRNLRQSERQLQSLIIDEFVAARKKGDVEVCDRLAQELLDGVWQDGITVKGSDEAKAYRERRDAEKRNVEGLEDVAILKNCLNGKWDRKLAFSIVQAIDKLVEKGWIVPIEDKALVNEARARCAREFEQEESDRHWREINETLHAAIQKEDCGAIRDALSAPEFLDRDPMDGMIEQAQAILDHAEAAQRRKTRLIVTASLLAVLSVLGVSGWWLKEKMFIGRCEDEAELLANLEKQAKERPQYVIGSIAARLATLKTDNPEMYAHPYVSSFETRLKALVAENLSRTNQIASLLSDLERMKAESWSNVVEVASVTGLMSQVESLLAKDDGDYRPRFFVLKSSWMDESERRETELHNRAAKFQTVLLARLGVVSDRLSKELARADLNREVADCQASLKEWKILHAKHAEDLEANLAKVEKSFNDALENQRAYTNALSKLCNANDAIAVFEAREKLVESFGDYPEVKALKPLSVSSGEVKDAISAAPAAVKAYVNAVRGGISQSDFERFLKDSVLVIADSPEYYSLYGLVGKVDPSRKIVAISKGKPDIKRPNYESSWTITSENGDLLSFNRMSFAKELKANDGADAVLMPSSDEMRTIVEFAKRADASAVSFESEILKIIAKHLLKSHADGFVAAEKKYAKNYNPIRGWRSPYRCVQFLDWYMRWLREDLKMMPNDYELTRWHDELNRLASPVVVDGVDESLAWICIWDERVKRRTVECAILLNRMPANWVERYRAIKADSRIFLAIENWKVSYAGKVAFDPFEASYRKNPDAIRVSAQGVLPDHPLYVLRKVDSRVSLVRAFEPGKNSPWRMCVDVSRTKEGYCLGEPLYHVVCGSKYIDVQNELATIAQKAGIDKSDKRLSNLPLFSRGGK